MASKILNLLFITSISFAQSITVTVSPSTLPSSGGQATVTLSCTGCTANNVEALGWINSFGTALYTTIGQPTIIQSGRPTICAAPACITTSGAAIPVTLTPLTDGPFVSYPITIANNPPSGSMTFSLLSAQGSTIAAALIPVITVIPAILTIGSMYDITGDGIVDGKDAAAAINMTLQVILNGIGKCTGAFARVTVQGNPGNCSLAAMVAVITASTNIIQ